MEFTKDNHLKRYFLRGGDVYSPDDRLIVEIGECSREPRSPFEEAKAAALRIAETASGRLRLCLSGGADSEAMAEAFIAAGVPFGVDILKFRNRLNWHDIRHAVRFCERNEIPYTLHPFDVVEFYESGKSLECAKLYRCRSPHLAVHLELMKRIDGVPILPWQPPLPKIESGQKLYLSVPNDHFFVYLRFLEAEKREGVPYFFLYSPELIYSFLRLPILQEAYFGKGIDPERYDEYSFKMRIYESGGFRVRPRVAKYTGFEKVKSLFQAKYKTSEPIYDQLYRYPLEKEYPLPTTDIRLSRRFLRTEKSHERSI
jgi:hypothetical protein